MPQKLILHSIDGSPPCRSVLMIIEILGLNVEVQEVNTLAGDQFKPEFLAKNPLHSIPLLEDGDFILPESHAIITYLVSKYGADKRAELYPNDLRIKAIVDQRLYFDATHLFSIFRAVIESVVKNKAKGPSEEQVKKLEEAYGYLEKYLQNSPFLATDHLTIADIAAVATVSTLDLMVPISDKYTKLREWLERFNEQSWYQNANIPGLKKIEGFLKHLSQQNA